MKYAVLITPRASKELADNPRRHGSAEPTGRDGRRIRIGDYRVLYTIDDSANTVTVFQVGHRRDVYR